MDASELYKQAYDLQFKMENPEEAYRKYLTIIRDFPGSREKEYALIQIEYIARTINIDLISIDKSLESARVTAKTRLRIKAKQEKTIPAAEKTSTVKEKEEKVSGRTETEKEKRIIVTTGDLKQDYEVIGPVYFQLSNRGNVLKTLMKQYKEEIKSMEMRGQLSEKETGDHVWYWLGEWGVGQNDFDAAFYISVEEIKKRAAILGADAIICMRQDIDIDTNGFQHFYLQMYGTAVRYL